MGLVLWLKEWSVAGGFRLRASSLAVGLMILVFSVLTFHQTRYWRSTVDLWEHAVDIDYRNGTVYEYLVDGYLKSRQVERGRKFFEAVLLQHPDAVYVHQGLGTLYLQVGLFDRAEVHLTEARRLFPKDLSNSFNLWWLHFKQGRIEEALGEYFELTKVGFMPDDGSYILFAEALAQEGKRAEALRVFRAMRELYSSRGEETESRVIDERVRALAGK
jgi:tetratricopeptide (TPR) repeat protein